jgi:putative membrane protein
MRITLILALLLAILVTIFAVQNNAVVAISFLAWKINGSLALVLMITLALGILIGLLTSAPPAIRRRLQVAEMKKSLRTLEKELEESLKGILATPQEEPPEGIPSQTEYKENPDQSIK